MFSLFYAQNTVFENLVRGSLFVIFLSSFFVIFIGTYSNNILSRKETVSINSCRHRSLQSWFFTFFLILSMYILSRDWSNFRLLKFFSRFSERVTSWKKRSKISAKSNKYLLRYEGWGVRDRKYRKYAPEKARVLLRSERVY